MSYFEGLWDFILFGAIALAILWAMRMLSNIFREYYHIIKLQAKKQMMTDAYKIVRLREIADRCGKSCTQIVLRWHLQRGLITVPRSTNFSHLKSNFDIFDFELSDADMLLIDSMNEDLRLRFDPDNCDFSKL